MRHTVPAQVSFLLLLTAIELAKIRCCEDIGENRPNLIVRRILHSLIELNGVFRKCTTTIYWTHDLCFNIQEIFTNQVLIIISDSSAITNVSFFSFAKGSSEKCSLIFDHIDSLNLHIPFKTGPMTDEFIQKLPGRKEYSLAIILIQQLTNEIVTLKLKYSMSHFSGLVHQVFVKVHSHLAKKHNPSGSQADDTFTCYPWDSECSKVTFENYIQYFGTGKVNLHGKDLRWASVYFMGVSQKSVDEYRDHGRNLGIMVTPIVEITERFNGTPRVILTSKRDYGTLDQTTGQWSGMMGEIVSGHADVGTPVLITKDRFKSAFLSHAIDSDGLWFVTGPPLVSTGSFVNIFGGHDLGFWVGFLICIVLLIVVIGRPCQYHSCTSVTNGLWFLRTGYKFILLPLMEQPINHVKNYLGDKRVLFVFGLWLLSLVVIGTTIKSSLMSSITSPSITIPPSSFDGLTSSKYKLGFVGFDLTAGVIYKELKAKGSSVALAIDRYIQDHYDAHNTTKCMKKVYGQPYACLGIRYVMEGPVITQLTGVSGEPFYRFSKETMFTTYYVFPISKNLPHLTEEFNSMMLHYSASGTYWLFKERFRSYIKSMGKLAAKNRNKLKKLPERIKEEISASKTAKYNELDMSHEERLHNIWSITRSLVMLAIGFSVATLVFIAEELLYIIFNK